MSRLAKRTIDLSWSKMTNHFHTAVGRAQWLVSPSLAEPERPSRARGPPSTVTFAQ